MTESTSNRCNVVATLVEGFADRSKLSIDRSIMSALSRSLLRRFAVSALRRPPVVVEQTAKAGRGVFATRDIALGEFILFAEPVVAHPKLDCISKVCYFCLKAIGQQDVPSAVKESVESQGLALFPKKVFGAEGHDASLFPPTSVVSADGGVRFCCAPCAVRAKSFFLIESRGDWSELQRYCRENYLKFPLLARRLACMVAGGAVSPDVLDILSYRLLPNGCIPRQWNEERALLLRTLKETGIPPRVLDFLSEEWYAGVIARFHINSFSIEMVDTANSVDLVEAAASSVSGEGSVGVAVYILPSIFNHDCDPNVDVIWPGNATVRLEARQMIKAGEELRISYVDASMAYDARQKILSESYGFFCDCPRCRDRD